MKKPLTLIIMDGFGINPDTYGNAIKAAQTPNLTKMFAENPCTAIGASGMDVGLPDGQMGNSEVGHTNIGAGRVVYQELTRITKSKLWLRSRSYRLSRTGRSSCFQPGRFRRGFPQCSPTTRTLSLIHI